MGTRRDGHGDFPPKESGSFFRPAPDGGGKPAIESPLARVRLRRELIDREPSAPGALVPSGGTSFPSKNGSTWGTNLSAITAGIHSPQGLVRSVAAPVSKSRVFGYQFDPERT